MTMGVSYGAVVCPPASAISPCTCAGSFYNANGFSLNCASLRLSDSQLSTILNVIINSNGISPLVELDASSNELTKIPSQISRLQSITTIALSQNQITAIPTGSFNYPSAPSMNMDLFSNKISSISSCAITIPNATSVKINLWSNQITSINSSSPKERNSNGNFKFSQKAFSLKVEAELNVVSPYGNTSMISNLYLHAIVGYN